VPCRPCCTCRTRGRRPGAAGSPAPSPTPPTAATSAHLCTGLFSFPSHQQITAVPTSHPTAVPEYNTAVGWNLDIQLRNVGQHEGSGCNTAAELHPPTVLNHAKEQDSCLDEDAADARVVGGLLERAAYLGHALGAAEPPLPLLADGAAQLRLRAWDSQYDQQSCFNIPAHNDGARRCAAGAACRRRPKENRLDSKVEGLACNGPVRYALIIAASCAATLS